MPRRERLSRCGAMLGIVLPFTAACYTGLPDDPEALKSQEDDAQTDESEAAQDLRDDAVGVSFRIPAEYAVMADEVLFDTGYGLMIYGPDQHPDEVLPHDREAFARITRVPDETEPSLEDAVGIKMDEYAEFSLEREEIEMPDGERAVAITGLPGVMPYSIVYVEADAGLYEIGLWSEDAEIDERGRRLLKSLSFHDPSVPIAALGLPSASDALYRSPPTDIAARNEQEARARAANLELQLSLEGETAEDADTPGMGEIGEIAGPTPTQESCGFTAPTSLMWQLQWDNTNAFYSGDWYNLRSSPGWSAMSGNYGSWWGTGFHLRKCTASYLNQYYANDWPAYYWDNVYAPFSGTVEWAGWGTDGFASLGRYVVVRKNGYRSLSAHLTAIKAGISWGKAVNLGTVIGYAGDTGEYYAGANWAPHIHARVSWGESLTWNGQPYGGQSVRPKRLRCWTCTNPDVKKPIGGFYTQFWHGRWMRH